MSNTNAAQKIEAWLAQFGEDDQERIIRHALDHVVPRMRRMKRLASLPHEQAARGSFMTREHAIEFCRRRRPGIEPTEQHIAATIDAYSALFGDMVPADLAPAPTAQVQESLSEERVEAAAMEMASTHWHWDRLGEVERNGFRARARDVLTAAWGVQLTKEGGNV
jgi:hypothetical protein